MNLQDAIRTYLTENNMSQRALSLAAGLGVKAISDILNIPGIRPRHSTLSRLSTATNIDLLALTEFQARTYADLLTNLEARKASEEDAATVARMIKRVRWLIGKTGWVAQLRPVCRAEILDFFGSKTPAELGLSPRSFATYKSDVLAAVREDNTRARARSILDVGGIWGELRKEIDESDLKHDLKLVSGAILVYLADCGIPPGEVNQATLSHYAAHRMATGTKDEATVQKHVKRIAHLVTKLANEPRFARFGCQPVSHPFADGRDKFGVSTTEIASLLRDWDGRVAPWARGLASRDGQTRDAFIAALDDLEKDESPERQRRRARRARRAQSRKTEQAAGTSRRDELLRKAGFLTSKDAWSEETARTRRGYVISLAKAYVAATDERLETVEDLTDPEVLEEAIEALADANDGGEFDSGYLESILEMVKKVACGFVCRSEEDIRCITDLMKDFSLVRHGIAPRNKAKLTQFTPARIQTMLDLTDLIVADVNQTVAGLRKAHRQKHGNLPKATDVYTPELARDVMAALAHAIMLKRGPRRKNLIGIQLDWISWQSELATIVIPAVEVKMRGEGDPDLTIPLGPSVSRLLRAYIDKIRAKALLPGDDKNPYLFPGQGHCGRTRGKPYNGILQRLIRQVHVTVGVRINPHLYRHLIGWIWLRDNLDNLPKVQRLLGHKSLQTTIDYYAEIDDELALDEWQQRLDRRSA